MHHGPSNPEAEAARAPLPVLPNGGSVPCPRCQSDLSRLPQAARFCARCGLDLLPDLVAPGEADSLADAVEWSEAAAAWRRMRQPRSEPFAPDFASRSKPVNPGGEIHSLMLIGYANAMYNLGRRYERGNGAARNPDEAIRCYFKAAKLGSAEALERLAPYGGQGTVRWDAALEPSPEPSPGDEIPFHNPEE